MKQLLILVLYLMPIFVYAQKSDTYRNISFALDVSDPDAIALTCTNEGTEPQEVRCLFASNFYPDLAFKMSPVRLWISVKCGDRIMGDYHDGFYNPSIVSSQIFTSEQIPSILLWGNSSVGIKTSIKTLIWGMFDSESDNWKYIMNAEEPLYYRVLFSDTLYFSDNDKKHYRILSNWCKLERSSVK